jgi:hypothetical protein
MKDRYEDERKKILLGRSREWDAIYVGSEFRSSSMLNAVPVETKIKLHRCFSCKIDIFDVDEYIEIYHYFPPMGKTHIEGRSFFFHTECFKTIAGEEYI